MSDTDHLGAFLESMARGDIEGATPHLDENIALRSPILPTPFTGRQAVASVLTQLVATVDAFKPKLLLRDGTNVIAVVSIKFGEHDIDAFDHITLGNTGLIETMTVAWRPLPAVVAVQQQLMPKLGGRALQLVPLD